MNAFRAAVIGATLFAALLAAAAPSTADGFRPIDVTVRPFSEFEAAGDATKFGELEFRGGLVLSSADRNFGALSGLAIGNDGESLLAVADVGFWFTAHLVESDGRLTGLTDGRIAPILDTGGKPRRAKRVGDAEALRLTKENGVETAIVAFEQSREVSKFAVRPDLAVAVARPVRLPDSARNLNASRGFETLAVAPASSPLKGATVLVAERALDRNGNHRGWILGGPQAGSFSIRRNGNFDITDGDFLPNGDLVILERLFNASEGVGARIRRFAAADIAPGKTAEGSIVMTAGLAHHRIDNMEGLTLRHEADGSASVFLISDDNQSFLQQTLILKFAWPAANAQ